MKLIKKAMSNKMKCVLVSSIDQYPSINVEEDKIYIGRSPATKIKSIHCSKKQLSVKVSSTPQTKELVLLVNRIGPNPSFLNGNEMKHFLVYEAKENDKIQVVKGLDLFYSVKFNTNLTDDLKRKNDSEKVLLQSSIDQDEEINSEPSPKRCKLTDKTNAENTSTNSLLPNPDNKWEDVDDKKLYIFTSKGVISSGKVAGYDIDGTIITTKSGRVFAKDCDDWQIAYNEVPGKLKELHKEGFKLVFFTNQAGVGSGKVKIDEIKKKFERVISKVNVPVQLFMSTGKNKYRKPVTGSWGVLTQSKNDGLAIDLNESFFCGDAAGRPEKKAPIKRKKDHSCVDRLFALNVGIKFYTPEEHFQHKPSEEWIRPEFDPKNLKKLPLTIPADAALASSFQELILMVGSPGSGKSLFARKYFEKHGYVYINRDTLGTWQKCVAALVKTLKDGQSAVIDNTNPDKISRKRYIEVATQNNVQVRCFFMITSEGQSKHNIVFRELTDPSHSTINDMVFNGYKSKFEEPSISEGFKQIVRVNFVPEFDNIDHENLYKLYLLEK